MRKPETVLSRFGPAPHMCRTGRIDFRW